MRFSLLLAGLATVPGPALCAVSTLDSRQPAPKKFAPPLRWASEHEGTNSETSALIERDPSHFESNTRLAINIAKRSTLVATGAIGFWGLIRECRSFSEDGETEDGIICVAGSIGTAISAVTHIREIGNWFITYGKEIAVLALGDFTQDAINRLQGIGPYLNGVGLESIGTTKRDHLYSRAAEASSKSLGLEVRHIGFWDGSMPGQPKARDASTVDRPVFGFNNRGTDYHFTLMDDEPGLNKTHIKLGHGPGPVTEHNKRKLHARKQKYNGQWFDRGGLDIIGRSDQVGDRNHHQIQPDLDNQGDFDWIMDHVQCSLGLKKGSNPPVLDEPGVYFQIYDDETRDTLSLGAMSPFLPEQPSLIEWMDLEAGLSIEDPCLALEPN
ncbi:hypothetical protein F66182_4167 [Fusarium sp. NRRL 66182]|nr:hypothetical protein F66182_4167 [Fusarium sp. NRRL 66182]